MGNANLIVSGRRLAEKQTATENALEAPPQDQGTAADLASLTGATMVDEAGLESVDESVDAEHAALEQDSLQMQFDAAVQLLQEADKSPGVFSTTENQIAAVLQSAVAEHIEDGKSIPAPDGGLEAQFDEHDVRWAFSLITWIGKLKPHAWQPPSREATPHEGNLKMALLGDWGTGLYGAPKCTASIENMGNLNYVIHLGDIYYSGTKREARNNFLDKWPKVPGAHSRACNGNHEMYSGGYGYFDVVLPKFEQSSSCFAIQNSHWLIVGLDSAYADHDLAQHQDAWLRRLVDAAGAKRRVVLFTHHQPFSHFDQGGEKLIAKLLPLLNAGRITAWYWGHEHRCVIYNPHPKWKFFGRCLGHSGYPYFREPSLDFAEADKPKPEAYGLWRELPQNPRTGVPRAILLDGVNPELNRHKGKYGPNGFVTLEFRDAKLIEQYYLASGELLTEFEI